MKTALVLVVAVVGVWAWTHHERTANEHRLAAVASELAGRSVGITCQGFWSELLDINNRAGEVQFEAGRAPERTFLTRKVCGALKKFRSASTHPELACLLSVDWAGWRIETDFDSPCSRRARGAAQAISTLTHEAMHLRGWINEAQAQCYSIQTDAWTVVRLGGTRDEGIAVANFILAQQQALPSEYQSSDCRAGGSLDLRPSTPEFPTEPIPQLPPAGLYGPAVAA